MNPEPENNSAAKDRKPTHIGDRLLPFLAIYITIPLIVLIGSDWYDPSQRSQSTLNEFVFTCFLTLILLPAGLVLALDWVSGIPFHQEMATTFSIVLLIVLSYSLFLLILSMGVRTEKPRTRRLLYFIFIGLVIISLAGCLGNPTNLVNTT